MRRIPPLLAVVCVVAVVAAWPSRATAQGSLPAHAHLAAQALPAGHVVTGVVHPVHRGAVVVPRGYVAAYPSIIHPRVPGHPLVVVPFPGHPPVVHPPLVHPPVCGPRVYRSYYYAAPYAHRFYYSTPGLSIGIGF